MRRIRYQRGVSQGVCDTCGGRYNRTQLRRCSDGLMRCTGSGTLNDASGRNAMELGQLEAVNAQTVGRNYGSGDPATTDNGDDISQQVDP